MIVIIIIIIIICSRHQESVSIALSSLLIPRACHAGRIRILTCAPFSRREISVVWLSRFALEKNGHFSSRQEILPLVNDITFYI